MTSAPASESRTRAHITQRNPTDFVRRTDDTTTVDDKSSTSAFDVFDFCYLVHAFGDVNYSYFYSFDLDLKSIVSLTAKRSRWTKQRTPLRSSRRRRRGVPDPYETHYCPRSNDCTRTVHVMTSVPVGHNNNLFVGIASISDCGGDLDGYYYCSHEKRK